MTDDSGGVLVDAVVRLSSGSLIGGPRTSKTDSTGRYRFVLLPPGDYDVAAAYTGMSASTRRGIALSVATTVTIDLTLGVAPVAERADARATAPLIDVRTASFAITLDEPLLRHIPTSHRTGFAALIDLAPGVTASIGFGGAVGANAIYVDGVDATEPRRQDPWLPVAFNWLQEAQVSALGSDVRFGDSTGVSANFLLRSGGNRFSGLGEYWTTAAKWIGQNQPNVSPRQIVTWWDASAQLGGPVLKDRLWFFSGAEYHRVEDRPPGFSGPGERSERTPRFLAKLTAAPAAAWRLEGFVQGNSSDQDAIDVSRSTPLDVASDLSRQDTSWNTRAVWTLSGRTLIELRNAGYPGKSSMSPHGPGTRWSPPHISDNGQPCCNAFNFSDTERQQNTTSAQITQMLQDRRLHRIDAGFELKFTSSHETIGFPAGARYLTRNGQPWLVQLFDGDRVSGTGRKLALYAQDEWAVHDRVTVTAGLRVDLNRGAVPERGHVFSTSPISPRLGVVWDVQSDHRTAVKAHYGRYHDPMLNAQFDFMDISQRSPTIVKEFMPDSGYVEVFRSAPPQNRDIDPDLSHSYVDQFVVGVERGLPWSVVLQTLYVRRQFRDFMAYVDTGSLWIPVERRDPGPDNRLGTTDDGSVLQVFQQTNPGSEFLLLTNPEGASRDYDALQIVATRPYRSGWQLQTSYTWTRNRGTVGNGRWTTSVAGDTGETGAFLSPNNQINLDGRAPFDHSELKVVGWGRLPWWGGFNVGGVFRWFTGTRWQRSVIWESDLRPLGFETVLVEPRGIRSLPSVKNLDVRLEKTFPLPHTSGTLGVFADVFNVANHATPTRVVGTSGRNFGFAGSGVDPRTLRLAVRYTF